jgi:predicted DsbA family dithiol-disulfide isomerase
MSKQITIDIVSDTVCPWCYVGKRRLEAALARLPEDLDVFVAWRPFQLNPDLPKQGADRREHLERKFGGRDGAKRVYDAINQAGDSVDIAFAFHDIDRQPNTVDSHRLIDRAGQLGEQDAVVEGLFKAYFLDGRDIGDIDTLVDVAGEAGLDRDETRAYLESDEDVERIRAEDEMARKMGVTGVPCFILNRKYAVSGAQEPEVFLQAFEAVAREAAEEEADADA